MAANTVAQENNLLPDASLEALAELISRPDPTIVGIVLTGSAARGMATQYSDVDVMVIRDESETDNPREDKKTLAIDELPKTLTEIETIKPVGSDGAWERWSYAWAQVLRDSTGGRITKAVQRQATLSDDEIRKLLVDDSRVDWFINDTYRALKSHRDGRLQASRLDSVEAIVPMLDLVFALAGRVRPYNKYLQWELTNHPLPSIEWQDGRLLGYVTGMLDGNVAVIRAAFHAVERECRAYDQKSRRGELGAIIDEWGSELDLYRSVN